MTAALLFFRTGGIIKKLWYRYENMEWLRYFMKRMLPQTEQSEFLSYVQRMDDTKEALIVFWLAERCFPFAQSVCFGRIYNASSGF